MISTQEAAAGTPAGAVDAFDHVAQRPGARHVGAGDAARAALKVLGSLGNIIDRFGKKSAVDPFDYLIGTAIGWDGNPRDAADYLSFYPPKNDGKTVYRLTLGRTCRWTGFWSISLYNDKGYFQQNLLNAYSINNLTAKPGGIERKEKRRAVVPRSASSLEGRLSVCPLNLPSRAEALRGASRDGVLSLNAARLGRQVVDRISVSRFCWK